MHWITYTFGLAAAAASAGFVHATPHRLVDVCHISSQIGEVLPRAKDYDRMFSGFILAAEQNASRISFQAIEPNKDISVVEKLKLAKQRGCDVIVGLISSLDALAVGPFLKANALFGISSTATSDRLDAYADQFRSFSVSAKTYASDLLDVIKGKDQTAVVFRSSDVFSMGLHDQLIGQMKHAAFIDLDQQSPGKFPDLSVFRNIVFTLYPMQSIPLLVALGKQEGKDLTIFGNAAWNETHVLAEVADKIVSAHQIRVLTPLNMQSPEPRYRKFRDAFQKRFKDTPDHDALYDYDVISYISMCVPPASGDAGQKDQLFACLRKTHVYEGVTGRYTFHQNKAHPQRKQNVVRYDFSGLIPEVEK